MIKSSETADGSYGHSLSDAEVRAAVSSANVPTLLMLVFQMTGDE